MDTAPKKILYTASTAGHLRSFHLPYLRALAERGFAVTAAAAGDGEGLPEGVAFLPVPFTKHMASPRNLRATAILARAIRAERYDGIVTHTSLAAFFTRLAVMLAGKKNARVVNTVHGYLFDAMSSPLRRSVMLLAEKLCAGVTDEILVMNREDLAIASKHRLCRGNVTLVPGMGVDLSRYAPADAAARRAVRESLGIGQDAFVLSCAAEFSRRKNQELLIRSLPLLPEDTVLLLPGDGALRQSCRALAEALGLADRVFFPGQMADVRPALAAADVYVSASRSEGLPFAVMEAMGCALPCILSYVKGHRDLLEGTGAGRLYPFGDAAALAAAAAELRSDPALRAGMGARGREAAARYGLETVFPVVFPHFTGI